MNILEPQSCPECKSSLVDDIQNGEIICSGCGVVVADQISDSGPETKSSNLEDKMKLARATGQTSYSQHDLGIATEISISSKDFSGKSINHEVANQMHNLRKSVQKILVENQLTTKSQIKCTISESGNKEFVFPHQEKED
jgi:transcription initiation factor TFIIB